MHSLWKTVWLQKKKIELPYDPAIPLLGMYLKKIKTLIQKDTCTPMFTAALFTIANIWKQMCVYIYIHNGILLGHKKMSEIFPFAATRSYGWT